MIVLQNVIHPFSNHDDDDDDDDTVIHYTTLHTPHPHHTNPNPIQFNESVLQIVIQSVFTDRDKPYFMTYSVLNYHRQLSNMIVLQNVFQKYSTPIAKLKITNLDQIAIGHLIGDNRDGR